MHELLRQAPPEAGVVDLLKRLRAHICHEPRGDFQRVLPVYERLLSPRDDTGISVQGELLEIRAKLLGCGEDADVVDVVDRMDQVVERCMEIEKKQLNAETAVPVEEVMRLLVALAGGDDGETFVLEDPMRTTDGESIMFSDATKKRIGDRIRMNDAMLLQRSRGIFNKPPVPLEESRLFSPDLFNAFGNGIPCQHSSLWCPAAGVAAAGDGGFLNMVPFKQPNRFIDLPGGSPHRKSFDRSLETNGTSKQQRSRTDAMAFKETKPQVRGSGLSPSKDVFFYDATREVHCGGSRQSRDWGEASSITENSSWGSASSLDATEPWIAQTYAWEELGNRTGLPAGYCRPAARGDKRSLRDLVVPTDFACRNHAGDTPLEIHEEDFIEDSLRALNGVDSAIFRRDFQTATFKLPEKRGLKLRNTTISATASVLEVFRKAGTMLMRLELLSIYYSQDPMRGGKTLQAMGDALQLYLSMHRSLVRSIAQECLESTLGETDREDEEIVSVAKLVCRTRKVCRVVETVGHVLGCDEDTEFWPLLQQDKFPRGVALLNRLHGHVLSLRVEDATGHMQELVTWFLVKSSSPMLAALSDLIASGRVLESTDPFDEFEVTTWSRNLLEKAASGGGDGLFSEELSTQAVEMLPEFLREIARLIIHLSQVQALLRSVDAMSSTHPLVNMEPLTMLIRGHEAVEHAEDWQATVAEAMASTEKFQHADTEIDTNVVTETLCTTENEPYLDPMLEQAEAKRNSQLLQRNLLDQQVVDKQQRQLQLDREDAFNDKKQVEETEQAQADEEAYGRLALLDKYTVLMDGAEERHDYMKWRRDRALRLSTGKDQLQCLYADDTAAWTADQETQSSDTTTGEIKEATLLVEGGVQVSTQAEELLLVATAGAPLTPALAPEWRTSVRVNMEAGNRTTVSMDDGTWRASVRVNTEAGNRTSASTNDGAWRASVKVNAEAGSRSSGVLGNSAASDIATHKTTVRVLNEPGGSGAEMYGALYGGPCGMPNSPPKGSKTKSGDGLADDIEMADSSSAVNQSEPTDDATPSEVLPQTYESEDVEIQDSTHDQEEAPSDYSDEGGIPSAETRGYAGPTESSRVSLPPVHPFFSWTIPEEDSEVLMSALTETLAEADLTSFASIVDCCVQVPVRLVAHNLEEVAVNWFRNAVQIVEHLRWLRKLMLMSEGLCMDIFARDFLLGLNSGTRVNWGVEGRLSSALMLAMIEGSVVVDAIAHNFHYNTSSALSQVLDSLTMTPSVPSLLSEIELVYDVAWPLGLVVTSQSLGHYQQMHRFLLYVRLTSLEMREAWGMLRTLRRQGRLSSPLERLSGGVIYKMQSFLRAFNETFATKVLMTAWSELEHASQKATTLAELRRCHEEYVAIAIQCCFLDALGYSTHSAFLDTLAAAWGLTGFVRGLERQVTGRASEETRIRALCGVCDVALWAFAASLHRGNHDAERSTREFSESLLLRLNFNHFYSTDDVSASECQEPATTS
ncbi:hypothetical protein KRP22_015044 [Phytophthora ramorum]|uniref:Gamma-tubulin complex component 6 n=1 Tax=Phytophthora ramorum TaxID=164328 RepID=UPI0030AA858E|nr:Gamma-tubulin complex component 6 [Phytophthora ramorum]KAH7504333.1 Gamma-tubulin complex component 6 [Phytophthora ramorum]